MKLFPAHVGLGSDFDGSVTTPIDTADLVQITNGLLASGMSAEHVTGVMGGNAIDFMLKALPK